MLGSLLLAAGGGLAAGAGGVLEGLARRGAADKERRYLKEQMRRMESEYKQGYGEERAAGLYALGRSRREALSQQMAARNRARALVAQTFMSAPYQAMSEYVGNLFREGLPAPLAEGYQNRLRAAQRARGTYYGGAPTKDEAATLTRMAEQQRMALLPQLRQMAMDPAMLQMQLENQTLAQFAASDQLESSQFNRLMMARQLPAQIAAARISPLAQLTMGFTSRMPYSVADPLAGGLQALSGSLMGMAPLLARSGGNTQNA